MMSTQSSLPQNVVFSAHVRMHNAASFYSITSNSISGLGSWEDIRLGVSCGVAVKVWSRQQFFQVIYYTPFCITCLHLSGFLHWWGRLHHWCHLHFWGRLYFEVFFISEGVLILGCFSIYSLIRWTSLYTASKSDLKHLKKNDAQRHIRPLWGKLFWRETSPIITLPHQYWYWYRYRHRYRSSSIISHLPS